VTDSATYRVAIRGASRRFPTATGAVDALDDVSVDIPAGFLVVAAGPSGSGKSTLLTLVACLDRPTSGSVELDGRDVTMLSRRDRRALRRRAIGIVLPVPSDNLLKARSAGGNVGWSAQIRAGRPGAATATAAAERLLAVVGLEGAKDRGARELSGGEQQRLALVCALAGSPALLVANEPTASLDAESAHAVATALRTLVDTTSVTMLVATHDRHIVDVADVVVPLDHGRRVG